jgi:Xaa-Pro aminopeptidase
MMAQRGFDALLIPCNTGHNEAFQADVRYLTQVGGFANEACVFFPLTGEPTCWVRADSQPQEWWAKMQDWVTDVRGSRCVWSDDFTTSIREHRLESARFGFVGIDGAPRSGDGLILHGTMTRLIAQFPNAKFEGATRAMAEVRMVKSDEEITALGRAARIAEDSVMAASRVARPGKSDHEVYAEIVAHMLRSGGEIPTLILWGAGVAPHGMSRLPPIREMGPDDIIGSEVEARYVGYIAQARRPMFLGKMADDYVTLHALAVECFNLMFERMKPGVTFGEVVTPYTELVKKRGYVPLAVPLHGRGLGEDLPLLNVHEHSDAFAQPMLEGQVFVLGPRVGLPDGSRYMAWGDTVAIGATGARRLGILDQKPIFARD